MTLTDSTALSLEELDSFASGGYVGPKPLLGRSQCALIMRYLRSGPHATAPEWVKARGVSERFLLDVATHPQLLAWVGQLLGPDVVVWGISEVERQPGLSHPWHTDIESSRPDARCVSTWIGLENVTRDSAVRLVRGSHLFGVPIQLAAHEHGVRRGDLNEAAALTLARRWNVSAAIVGPEMTEGDVLLFDGRIWHGSHNSGKHTRTALLIQFAEARTPIHIPDFTMLEWPFHLQRYPRPPCIAVTGSGIAEANRLVSAPPTPPSLPAQFRELSLPLDHDPQVGWRPHPQFGGSTPIVDAMSCHVSVLCTGRQPHLPHAHLEEELLVVLEGEGELVMPSGPDDRAPRLEPLPPGSFVYYPAFALHTISNRAESPVTYLMFKWRGAPDETRNPLPTSVVRLPKAHDPPPADAFSADFLFEGSTAFLGKLHSHVTELRPGGGYAAHADEHDVAIVVLSGRVVTNNRSLGRHGIVYFPAGEPHDMWNPWAETARYLVFEFHRPASARVVGEPQ